jgi:2-aminoethylphosphonate-pyruvate transaminase
LISGLENIGLKYHVALENQSHLITTIQEPDSIDYSFDDLHDYMINKDFTIYPGKVGELNTFRIANIGDIHPDEMSTFIEYLSVYMDKLN